MKKSIGSLLGAFLVTLAACGSLTTEHSLTGRVAAPYSGEVQVVMEGSPRPNGIREIAIIQVAASGNRANMPDSIEALKARARELGCNVVVNVRVDRGSAMSTTGVCGTFAN